MKEIEQLRRRLAETEKTTQALRESEERYRQIVEFTSEGFVKVDPNSIVVFANLRLSEILGYGLSELIGKSLNSFMTAESQVTSLAARDRRRAGVKDTIDITFRRRDGSHISVSMAGAPIFDESGVYIGSLASVRDVTEQKKMMAQMVISDRMASIGTLAAGVAHEINNPLAVVMANLDYITTNVHRMLRHSPQLSAELGINEDFKGPIDDALEAADRVRLIVRELMNFSRSPDEELQRGIDVRQTLESSLRMASNEIRHRARLEKDFDDVPFVKANEAQLSQVFLNLIVNAAQAIPEGRIDENQIKVTTRRTGERVVIEIHDTGEGIPPENIGRIFDAFFTTKPVGLGTGLGLSISHRIITGLGGALTMTSEVGKGTIFTVSLPVDAEVPEKVTQSTSSPIRISTILRGRVLIVDDEEMILRIVRRILSDEHEIVTALTGKDALSLCMQGDGFDVILCDLMMPNMGGMDLYRELLRVAPLQAKNMIFVTGGAFTPQAQEFLAQDNRECISKPFDPLHLREIVQRHLHQLR